MIVASIQPASAVPDPALGLSSLAGGCCKIGRVHVVFTGNPDQGEECIAAGIGERRSHAMRGRRFGNWANRPIGGDPLARRMGQHRGQIDHPRLCVRGGRLHHSNFMLPERLAHDVEPARQGCVPKRLPGGAIRADGGGQRFLRIDKLALGLGQRRRKLCDRLARSLHERHPGRAGQN